MGYARCAAVLAVLMVIGVAGWAQASDGDPLILGGDNVASTVTTYTGHFSIDQLAFGNVESPSAGVLTVKEGVTIQGTPPNNQRSPLVVATVQGRSTVWVVDAHVTRTGRLIIALNAPAPKPTRVAYW